MSIGVDLSALRQEVGIQLRREHLCPHPELDSEAEQIERLSKLLGMSTKICANAFEGFKADPLYKDIVQGHRYREGHNVDQDYTKAAQFYARAAAKGNPEGMYNLAKLHEMGKGVKQDFVTSLHWLRMAAEFKVVGIAEAQHSLGLKYNNGVGVQKDYKEAAKWYEMAVKNGSGPSANNLGILYQNGTGVDRSLEKAFHHFKIGAERQETPAMMNLADCYFMAQGTGSFPATDNDWKEGRYVIWIGI